MATSGSVAGTFSGASHHYPYVAWSITQDLVNNYSDVTAVLHFVRTSYNYSYNTSTHSNTSNVDGNTSYSGDSDFDTRSGTGDYTIRTVTQRVYHNSDGTKTAYIGWSGNTNTSLGTYNFGQNFTFDTIPREAYITTGSVNFTIADNSPYTPIAFNLWNGGNYYVRARLYVGANLITTRQLGRVTSASFNLTDAENHALYALIPNATSGVFYWSIATFSDSGYSSQIGGNRDKAGTFYITDTYSKPTFTTYTIANVDESHANTDKYSNVLVTSNTNTLTGSAQKIISGYNKPRATIANGDRMTPLHSSTAVKYRFVGESRYAEVKDGAGPLTVDLADVTANSFSVTAYDSRGYITQVTSPILTSIVTPTAVNLWDLTLTRTNNVETETTLAFSGEYWKAYFGGGTDGVLNTVKVHYRYKETTDSWGAQSWVELTPTDTDGSLSFEDTVNGDLGASGFDADKSFNIEVRLYDKLTNIIIEGTLSKGTPVLDLTQDGVAVLGQYNTGLGGALQVTGDTYHNGIEATELFTKGSLFRQAIINGNFDVWQRGTSFVMTAASSTYGPDRWRDTTFTHGGTNPTLTRTREVLTAGELLGSFYYNRLTTNGAGSNLGNGSHFATKQCIENGVRFLCGLGKKVTISFWARSSIANKKIGVNIRKIFGTGGSPSNTLTINGEVFTLTSSWQKFTKTFDTDTIAGKTFGTNNDDYIELQFFYMWGVNVAPSIGTTSAQTFIGAGTIDIAQVQLCAGDVALPFSPKSFGDELLACMRYYQKSYAYGTYAGSATMVGAERKTIFTSYLLYNDVTKLYLPMRASPVVTYYDTYDGTAGYCTEYNTGSTRVADRALNSASNVCEKQFATSSNNAFGGGNWVAFHWTATAEL